MTMDLGTLTGESPGLEFEVAQQVIRGVHEGALHKETGVTV